MTSKKIKVTSYKWEDVEKHIVSVGKNATSLKVKIHSLGVTIAARWASHDISPRFTYPLYPIHPTDGRACAKLLTELQQASPYHSKAFASWVSMLGMQWAEETETWYIQEGQKLKKDALDSAKINPFWEVSPPPKANPLTDEMVVKMLEGILKKQQKHDKESVDGDDYSKKGNESIRAAIVALKG